MTHNQAQFEPLITEDQPVPAMAFPEPAAAPETATELWLTAGK